MQWEHNENQKRQCMHISAWISVTYSYVRWVGVCNSFSAPKIVYCTPTKRNEHKQRANNISSNACTLHISIRNVYMYTMNVVEKWQENEAEKFEFRILCHFTHPPINVSFLLPSSCHSHGITARQFSAIRCTNPFSFLFYFISFCIYARWSSRQKLL